MQNKITINNKEIELTHLDKEMWPGSGYTKKDLIRYYIEVSPVLLPHLRNRPFVMSRYPDGIDGKMFYQKDCPEYAPDWIETFPVYSETSKRDDKVTRYILCNNTETLVWLANQACIEMHPWSSGIDKPDYPDIAVFDLDPMPPAVFEDTFDIAVMISDALSQFKLSGYPKTSGSTGIHIFVPILPERPYEQIRNFVEFICRAVHNLRPNITTMERPVKKRGGKVYLDYLQNSPGKTMACQYSLRPNPGAPASAPLSWEEIREKKIRPLDFNINTMAGRIKLVGDLSAGAGNIAQSLSQLPDSVFVST